MTASRRTGRRRERAGARLARYNRLFTGVKRLPPDEQRAFISELLAALPMEGGKPSLTAEGVAGALRLLEGAAHLAQVGNVPGEGRSGEPHATQHREE